MLEAINRVNGGTHDTNIQVYEHTGKKFKRIKYSRLCVCVCVCSVLIRIYCVCVCVCVYKNIYVKCTYVCVCERARAF